LQTGTATLLDISFDVQQHDEKGTLCVEAKGTSGR